MTDGRRRWARITTASSAILLLVAVISLIQVSDKFIETYNPEENHLVKLVPGESKAFEIKSSVAISALRVSDGGSTPNAELTLTDSEGNEILGRKPGFLDVDRISSDKKTIYSPVRVFENIEGQFTLNNQGSSDLWLVDDEESLNEIQGMWMYLFYFGCCLGSPIGVVGLVLAIMVWTDKRKLPDQFVIIEDGSVVIGSLQDGNAVDSESAVAPSPFVGDSSGISEIPQEEEEDVSWKGWDDG